MSDFDNEKQTKISSFFENHRNEKKESKLFTKISATSLRNPGKLALPKPNIPQAVYQEREKKAISAAELKLGQQSHINQEKYKDKIDKRGEDVVCIDLREDSTKKLDISDSDNTVKVKISNAESRVCENLNLSLKNHSESNFPQITSNNYRRNNSDGVLDTILFKPQSKTNPLKSCGDLPNSEQPVSLERQEVSFPSTSFTTPEKPKTAQERFNASADSSPDIICETPDVDSVFQAAEARRKRAISSRSFLCKADLVAVQPGLKPAHLRVKHGREARLLGKISVNFNHNPETRNELMADKNAQENVSCHVKVSEKNFVRHDTVERSHLKEPDSNCDSDILQIDDLQAKPDGDKKMDTAFELQGSDFADTDVSSVSIPETQFFEDIANEIVSEIEMDTVSKASENCLDDRLIENASAKPTNAKFLGQQKDKLELENNSVDMEKQIEKSTAYPDKAQLLPDRARLKGGQREQRNIFASEGMLDIKRKTHSGNVIHGSKFERTKSRSKLINALEEADVKAEETEETLWMGERLMKHFAEDDHIIDRMTFREKEAQVTDTTPVKKYDGTKLMVKRLSKPGASPMSKRRSYEVYNGSKDVPGMNNALVNDGFNLDVISSVDNAKKILDIENVSSHEPQTSKSRLTEQRASQFGWKKKVTDHSENKQITLEDDRLLTELLGKISSSSSKATHQPLSDVLKELNPVPDKTQEANYFAKGNLLRVSKENNGFHIGLLTKLKQRDSEFLDKLLETDNHKDFGTVEKCEAETNKCEKFTAKKKTYSNLDVGKNDRMGTEEVIMIMDTSSAENVDENYGAVDNPDCIIIDDGSEDFNKNDHDKKSVSLPKKDLNSDSVQKNPSLQTNDSTVNEPVSIVHEIAKWGLDNSQIESVPCSRLSDDNLHIQPSSDKAKLPNDSCNIDCVSKSSVNCTANNRGSANDEAISVENNAEISEEKGEDSTSVGTTELSASVCEMLSESFRDDDADFATFKKPEDKKRNFRFTDLWNRYTVMDVTHDRVKDENQLRLQCERTGEEYHCILRGFWVDTVVDKGDIVNVIGNSQGKVYTIEDRNGLIIVNPDLLLSGTLVVSSVFCQRKSVLNEKFKGLDTANLHMLHGSIIHSLFQTVLKEGIIEEKHILQEAKSLLKSPKFLHEMYSHSVEESTVLEEISQYVPALMSWLNKHTASSRSRQSGLSKGSDLLVTGICDIEENIWSPRLGLKGKIDMTVKARLRKSGKLETEKILPLELKTGKASFSAEHKGQVTLYSMMYSDRQEDPGEGILLYLKHREMQIVPVRPESKSGLLQLRNQLAHYLTRQVCQETTENGQHSFHLSHLPRPINNQRACSECAHLLTCSVYQRSVEETVHPEKHAMATLVPEALRHLEQAELDYFLHWTLCLDLEGQESRKVQLSQIWRSSSAEREENGDCLSNLIITNSELGVPESQSFNEGKGCSLTFSRHPSHNGPSLSSLGLACSDMVVISSEDGRYIALATGLIRSISQDLVEVVVDRDYLHDNHTYNNMKFTLDRNDSFSISGYLYTNLARLMESTPRAKHLRNLLVQLQSPQFELKLSKSCIQKVKPVFKPLNKPQRMAILKVLMAKDYVLIKGFPGTGKTSTIVALVKILQLIGKSVLLTSYTHSAVDNILMKLKEDQIPFLRLGRRDRIHSSILPHAAELLTSSPEINSVQKLKEFYESFDVVATSCLGVNHSLFSQRKFDVCIVDEASQVLQPACLGPLFHCNKFVLVGDPQQLPPLVQSKEASRNLGMDESLFARLDRCGATYELDVQYRMNRVIMELSNLLVYEGKLQCGSREVADACLRLNVNNIPAEPLWMTQVLSPDLEKSVVFLDTRQIKADETQDGKGVVNNCEAELVLSILRAAVAANVDPKCIGVMSPYRSQVKLIKRSAQNCQELTDIEANTVDQYQGRDKSVIIMSFVRSQNDNMGELLKDLRRLNVAFTRARHKLILIGNVQALKAYSYLATVLTWLESKDNIIALTR